MADFKNEFTWSKSRDDCFRTCPRQYYFQYYGSWGGWEATASQQIRRLYVLKQLKTRPMWAGERVHTCIEHSLRNLRRGIDVLNPEKIIEVTVAEMRNDFRSSRSKNYWARPKTCALFEHEYEVPVTPDEWRETAERVQVCLNRFYGSDLFARLRALPRDAWLGIEELDQFTLGGVKVWVKIDCCFRDEGGLWIVDWKTGRRLSEENTLQLVGYSLYAHKKWGVSPETVRTAEYYLLVDEFHDYGVTQGDIDDAKAYVLGSVEDMTSLLVNVGANEPMAEEAFVKTQNPRECRRCKFVGPCRPELVPELQGNEAN
ncbi:PD-(D/E)XK nuclease family protein [bacterium]|nr:PD-(D/E)XK nuclease family protein [bacterium]